MRLLPFAICLVLAFVSGLLVAGGLRSSPATRTVIVERGALPVPAVDSAKSVPDNGLVKVPVLPAPANSRPISGGEPTRARSEPWKDAPFGALFLPPVVAPPVLAKSPPPNAPLVVPAPRSPGKATTERPRTNSGTGPVQANSGTKGKEMDPAAGAGEAPAAAETPAVQCAGVTRSGNRCRRKTHDASGFCYQHQPAPAPEMEPDN